MILQALNEYYERKFAHQATSSDTDTSIAPKGFENKKIPFVIVIDASGALVQIDDTSSGDGKKKRARSFLVPQGAKKSVNVAANLLWGNAEYVLGIPDKKKLEEKQKKGKEKEYLKRLDEMRQTFVELIHTELSAILSDPGVAAVLAFLANPDLDRLSKESAWQEIENKNPNLTFRLARDRGDEPVCARPAVVAVIRMTASDADASTRTSESGFCLVCGEPDAIERLHPAIKGVWDAQTSGANIVSFNRASFNSYGKDQGANAPIGERAAFNYTTALNHLLRKGSPQRLQVGDASTVFWAVDKSNFENTFAVLFGAGDKDDPDRGTQAFRNLVESTKNGVYVEDDSETRFCVLGLAPNAARIAVRFWQTGPVRDFALHIRQHFDDIEIDRAAYEKPYLSLFRILTSVALLGKAENIPHDLAGDTMRAILGGLPYPAMLLQAAVRRCRAEQAKRNAKTNKQELNVPYPRAAIIKASLNRLIRTNHFQARTLTMSLDRENKDVPYLLGRLFATFERLQQAAHKSESGATLNRTIRESYYGSASSSPSSAFPTLVKLHQHHLSKLERSERKGLAHYFRSLVGGICDSLPPVRFPAHLSLPDQGLFAIGYYQQQQDRKSNADDTTESTDTQGEQ